MSSSPKPVKAPFQQQQQQQQTQQNTYGLVSLSDTPEARALLETPLDFGDDVGIDPGVGRRTDLAEQDLRNRWDSAFNAGIPREYRTMLRDSEIRKVRSQGAAEAQDAEFRRKQLSNQTRTAKTLAELERRRQLMPTLVSTGGSGTSSGTSSGFNTQVTQPQGGFLQSFGQGLGAGLGGALPFI